MRTSLKGRLLVATPLLEEPEFYRTVILVIEHTNEGAAGVVLNRPSELAVASPLPAWADLAAPPDVVFVGGPVSPESVVCLGHASEPPAEGWQPVVHGYGAVDLQAEAGLLRPALRRIRVFAGYSGWRPNQLETELASRAWFVLDAAADDLMPADPSTLWSVVLRRQPGRLSLFASYPPDPRLN